MRCHPRHILERRVRTLAALTRTSAHVPLGADTPPPPETMLQDARPSATPRGRFAGDRS